MEKRRDTERPCHKRTAQWGQLSRSKPVHLRPSGLEAGEGNQCGRPPPPRQDGFCSSQGPFSKTAKSETGLGHVQALRFGAPQKAGAPIICPAQAPGPKEAGFPLPPSRLPA